MRRVRAYSRDERKRLIIYVFAEAIRKGEPTKKTCAAIAQKQDMVPSTKLRKILAEMVADGVLVQTREDDAGIAGFRLLYELNYDKPGYSEPKARRTAVRLQRIIRLNPSKGTEVLTLS